MGAGDHRYHPTFVVQGQLETTPEVTGIRPGHTFGVWSQLLGAV